MYAHDFLYLAQAWNLHTDQSKCEWIIYQKKHVHLGWSVCKFQAHDRYRKSRYFPHMSDTQYAYVRLILSLSLYYIYSLPGTDT